MTKYFKQSWTGNFYHAAYDTMLARGENDIFFAGVVVGDFTGDGIADVLQQMSSNEYGKDLGNAPNPGRFLLLEGHKNGTYTDKTSLLPDGGIYNIASRHLLTGDVNGDGRPDIVAIGSYEDGRLIGDGNAENVAAAQVAYVSNGAGHWDVVSLDNYTWAHGAEVDDFDGDGRDDIISGGFVLVPGHQSGTVVSTWHQDGSQTNSVIPVYGATFQLADVDGDGANELATTYVTYANNVLLASGLEVHEIVNGELGPAIQSPIPDPVRQELGWEWNGDAAMIPVYEDNDGNEYVYGQVPDNLKSADVDGDGKEEIVGLQNRAQIGRRDDGKIDVGLSHDAITKVIFYGYDGTSLVERTDMTVTGFAPALNGVFEFQFIDFNFDGHVDLYVSRPDSGSDAPLQVFLNDGAGHFKEIGNRLLPIGLPPTHKSDAVPIDVNGDMIMDLLVRPSGHSPGDAPWGAYSEALFLGTTKFYTGPKYADPALKGAPGFNEQYYLNTHADAAAAVASHKYKTGLDHYLAVGKKHGYFGFAVDTHISGSDGKDTIKAREGAEWLDGGLGKDKLTGGGGADTFVFSTKLEPTNVDTIKDFKPGDGDMIALDHDIFKKIGAVLDDGEFFAKQGAVKAHDKNDRIIYDTKSGKLYYDDDGNKKHGHDAVLFATLDHKPVLHVDDFLIV